MESPNKQSLAKLVLRLRERVLRLESSAKFVEGIEPRLLSLEARESASTESGDDDVRAVDRDVLARLLSLQSRLEMMEGENHALTHMCLKLQEQNEAMTRLFGAEQRLRTTSDSRALLDLATELLVDLLRVKEFAIFERESDGAGLRRVCGRGPVRESNDVPLGARLLSMVGRNGKPFYYESSIAAGRRGGVPLVAIPIKRDRQPIGVLAVFSIEAETKGLSSTDHQLLELIADHIASALAAEKTSELDLKGA